ncbi:hypothetical protein N9948_00340 [bacterium]|nr:hypothetical protein [bacterium]
MLNVDKYPAYACQLVEEGTGWDLEEVEQKIVPQKLKDNYIEEKKESLIAKLSKVFKNKFSKQLGESHGS